MPIPFFTTCVSLSAAQPTSRPLHLPTLLTTLLIITSYVLQTALSCDLSDPKSTTFRKRDADRRALTSNFLFLAPWCATWTMRVARRLKDCRNRSHPCVQHDSPNDQRNSRDMRCCSHDAYLDAWLRLHCQQRSWPSSVQCDFATSPTSARQPPVAFPAFPDFCQPLLRIAACGFKSRSSSRSPINVAPPWKASKFGVWSRHRQHNRSVVWPIANTS
jgi:hypothetical protein